MKEKKQKSCQEPDGTSGTDLSMKGAWADPSTEFFHATCSKDSKAWNGKEIFVGIENFLLFFFFLTSRMFLLLMFLYRHYDLLPLKAKLAGDSRLYSLILDNLIAPSRERNSAFVTSQLSWAWQAIIWVPTEGPKDLWIYSDPTTEQSLFMRQGSQRGIRSYDLYQCKLSHRKCAWYYNSQNERQLWVSIP